MVRTGECRCGAVTFQLAAEAELHVYVCHCLACQTWNGSAFGEHAMLRESDLVCRGPIVTYAHETNGMAFNDVACAHCHTRVYNSNSSAPELVFLRAGTLLISQELTPVAHIWVKRKQSWISIPPEVPAFDESPTPDEFSRVLDDARARRRGG